MYNHNYTLAGKGLKTMFIGEIVTLISAFLVLIPFVGIFGMLAGFVLTIVGLNTAGPAHESYKTALYVTVANVVVNVLQAFLGGLIAVVGTVMSCLVVYLVCKATAELLSGKGDEVQAKRGASIWKTYAVCTVIGVVCQLLIVIPIVNLVAGVVSVIAAIVLFVAGVLYLIFLLNASQSLQE